MKGNNNDRAAVNSATYFENRDCKYYPCHKCDGNMNCLFCYCPLYLRPDCPGSYKMKSKGEKLIKDCSDCMWPHEAKNYPEMIKLLKQ